MDDHAIVQTGAARRMNETQPVRSAKSPELDSTEAQPTSTRHPPSVPTIRSGPNATVRTSPEKVDDPSWVVDAIRALRQEHDPIAAKKLLSEYLKVCPDGALSEEALALSIEAAVESADPDALTVAARYLEEFPNGQFRRAAELVMKRRQR